MNQAPEINSAQVQLADLVGEHELSGVDFGLVPKVEDWDEDAETCTFVLDGQTYTVTEDPSDGYRSHMKDLVRGGVEVTNRFTPCKVIGSLRDEYQYGGESDMLEFRDVHTGRVVLAIGTENTDDYYPSFRAEFSPEAMEINKNAT